MSLHDSFKSFADALLEWLRPVTDKISVHESRLDTLSELSLRRHDTLKAGLDIDAAILHQHDKSLQDLNSRVGDLTRSIAEHFNGLETDIAYLKAEVSKLSSSIDVPDPTPDTGTDTDTGSDEDPIVTYDSSVTINVKNYSHITAVKGSYVTVAVPIPRAANILDPTQFSLCSFLFALSPAHNQAPIHRSDLLPCDTRVTARWDSAKSSTQPDSPIRWILVTFAIDRDIAPGVTYSYELLIGTDQPVTPDQLDVIRRDDDASFDILVNSSTQFSLTYTGLFAFDNRSGTSTLSALGTTTSLSPTTESVLASLNNFALTPQRLYIEYQGPLTAIIVVEGTLPHPSTLFPGPVSVRRRYQFYANSPTVHVTESLTFEGTFNGGSVKREDQTTWNAILGNLFRESFKVTNPTSIRILDTVDDAPYVYESPLDKPISLSQLLRDRRLNIDNAGKKALNQTRYELRVGSSPSDYTSLDSGPDADGGLLSVSTPTSSVTACLRHMHRYEPQSISFDPSTSTLNLDLASDRFRLAHHQGLFVEYSITVSPLSQPDLLSIWCDLNTPLIGLVSPEWINASGATWNGIPPYFALASDERLKLQENYAKCVRAIIDSTLRKRASEGMQGLLTWGLYPQYWGEWNDFSPDGLGSGLKGWDQTFTESTFTDYWNTTRLAVEGAIALSNPSWINDITLPSALRMLYTQIVQGPPDISLDRVETEKIGTSTYGYSLYRSDANSSHQYWENLFWYYYLSGDYTVVERIERGARVQLRRFKSGTDTAARQPCQWLLTFLFLDGVSRSTDIDWSAEFVSLMTRTVQRHYVGGLYNGQYEAVWITLDGDPSKTFTNADTHSFYDCGYYDMECLYQLGLRTNDATIKLPYTLDGVSYSVSPFACLQKLASTSARLGLALANPTPAPGPWISDVSLPWSRILRASWDGNGTFTSIAPAPKEGQSLLFPDDLPAMCAWFSRAARLSRDPYLTTVARNLLAYSFERILGKGAATGVQGARLRDIPMGKLMGLCTGRLGTGVVEMMKLEEEMASANTEQ